MSIDELDHRCVGGVAAIYLAFEIALEVDVLGIC
jgi:hypothetical protein